MQQAQKMYEKLDKSKADGGKQCNCARLTCPDNTGKGNCTFFEDWMICLRWK
jgi:hypothetical protein